MNGVQHFVQDMDIEYLLIPFGWANEPATFQDMMNDILGDLINHGTVVYIDDILIYTPNEDKYVRLTREVNCKFHEIT
jgi:hypothetical protein